MSIKRPDLWGGLCFAAASLLFCLSGLTMFYRAEGTILKLLGLIVFVANIWMFLDALGVIDRDIERNR